MGTDPESSRKSALAPVVRRRRWKRWLLAFGILLLLILAFQRPLLLAALRWELARYAEGQHFELRCEIEGDPIRYLEIRNLELKMPDPDAVQSLKAGRIRASYNIFGLIFSGWGHVLKDAEVENVDLVLRDSTQGSASESDSFWVPFPRSLRLKNFNLDRGVLHIKAMEMTLLPGESGSFSLEELHLPEWGDWKKLSASTRYERGKIDLDGLELKPFLKAEHLELDGSNLSSKQLAIAFNGLLFGGTTELTADWRQKKEADVLEVALSARNLSLDQASDLLEPGKKFGGKAETLNLKFSGELQNRGTWTGAVLATLKNGTVQGSPAWETLALKAEFEKGRVALDQFALFLNAKNQLQGKGVVQLARPFQYEGNLHGGLEDLGSLQGLLEIAGIDKTITGKLEIDWSGKGEGGLAPEAKHDGSGFLVLQNASWGETKGIEAELRGSYTPERADFPMVKASAAGWRLLGIGGWQNRRLQIQGIQILRGTRPLLQGSIDVPFYPGDWRNPGQWLSPGDPVNIQLQGQGIQLESLMRELAMSNPWKGEISLNLNASGTLKDLQVAGSLQGKNLVPGINPDFLPAQLAVDLKILQNQLNVSALLTQPALQPVKVWGTMEFQASDFLNGSKDWLKAPIRAQLAMASMDLGRLKRFYPQILDLQGRLGADVQLAGSIADPILWGAIDLSVPRLRFNRRAIPNLTDMVGRIKFEERKMQIETMRGNLAGGPFQISGGVDFEKLSDPFMDVRVKGTDLLLYRDDHVTSRADVALGINGPLNSAKVSGTVALTKSQFFRNIDILPIGLPGHSAPEVPASLLPEFSVKIPPISNWNFDVKISNKDPFLIKGNLANGRIDTKLQLTGTGLAPKLDGMVSITNLEATLPFSTLLLDRGFLYFKPDQGLNATLDFRGTSKIQDYEVTAYVYGSVLRPQTLFVSQPPLSEQDIIALIATGSTTTELGSNSNVIAGKATSLLFQKIWRKLFPDAKVSKNELLDRVSFNVGSIDPESATPSLGASLKITDEVFLIFDTGTEGSFRGRVKYLIRFR